MIEKLLKIANGEIGYLEKASNKELDDKIANAGKGNYTKYARDLDGIKDFYNGKKNGYPWCDVFVDWCFVKAFGIENAKTLLNQPMKSLGAGTTFSAKYFKNKGQFYSIPQTGDQIFFKNGNGDINHTGIVVKVDSNYVYTIEGNTSSDEGVVANGGSVNDKKYKLNYNRIAGYGRPKYSILPEDIINDDTDKDKEKETDKDKKVDVIYQSYDNVKDKWLGIITNYNDIDIKGYAGNFGNSMGGLKVKLSDNSKITVCSHILGKDKDKWLKEITKWDDTAQGYSGIMNQPIDAIMIKSKDHKIEYRVHLKESNRYLNWISGYDKKDWKYGYAGNLGQEIDAIQIRVVE